MGYAHHGFLTRGLLRIRGSDCFWTQQFESSSLRSPARHPPLSVCIHYNQLLKQSHKALLATQQRHGSQKEVVSDGLVAHRHLYDHQSHLHMPCGSGPQVE